MDSIFTGFLFINSSEMNNIHSAYTQGNNKNRQLECFENRITSMNLNYSNSIVSAIDVINRNSAKFYLNVKKNIQNDNAIIKDGNKKNNNKRMKRKIMFMILF